MKEYKLPSGATLRLTLAPFAQARELYQSVLDEAKIIKLDLKTELDADFFKTIFCSLLSSKKVEDKIWACLEKCLYNNFKVTLETFEPEEARQDYVELMFIVGRENILPFTKGLSARYGLQLESIMTALKS